MLRWYITRVSDQNGVSLLYHAWDTLFWSGTLELFTIFTRFLSSYLLYVIHRCECSGYFMSLCNKMTAQVPAFLKPARTQDNGHKTTKEETSSLHINHASPPPPPKKKKKNKNPQKTNKQKNPKPKQQIKDKKLKNSMGLNKPKGHGSINSFSYVDWAAVRHLRENDRRSFWFLIDLLPLNGGQSHSKWHEIIQFSGVCHLTMFKKV